MIKQNKLLISIGILVGILFIAGLTVLAATNYGSKEDPLVTLSYLNSTVTPEINKTLDSSIKEAKAELTDAFDDKISSRHSDVSAFSVLSLSKGDIVTCSVGTEIMLRVGSVSSYGSNSPRLIDETDGTQLSSDDSPLTTNHMYMVTIKNNGIKATSSAKVIIKGTYTVK